MMLQAKNEKGCVLWLYPLHSLESDDWLCIIRIIVVHQTLSQTPIGLILTLEVTGFSV